jgi:aspartyl-tRNA(Asn)/glutamyl-tRNA(Gln) amidotransferase subunit A
MTDLHKITIAEARSRLRKKEITSVELTEACISAVEGSEALNAYCVKTPELAREQAKKADELLLKGNAPDMCGIPLGIKDLFCTKNVNSQAASKGAIMLGKLNMDEFAMGSSNETSVYGPAVNPWQRDGSDKKLTAGGSSGGSASAVAADLCLAATGTDTGGSIRQPAAFTGIVGVKPTYGRVSRWGIIAFASSLDQAGPMTKTVKDSAIFLNAISGHDTKDSTSAPFEVPDFEAAITGDIKGKKIGIPKEYRLDGMPGEIEKLWQNGSDMLRDAGAEIVDVSLPHTKYALPAYYVLAPAEASSNLARYDGVRYGHRAHLKSGEGIDEMYARTRSEGFGDEVKRRVMVGAYVLSAGFYDAYYRRAQRVRSLIKKDFDDVYSLGVDAILTPATPSAAFGLGEMKNEDPIKMYLNDVFTVTVNLAGLPGVSVPAGLSSEGLPLGLQLIGRPWEEGEMLNVASILENGSEFNMKPNKWW